MSDFPDGRMSHPADVRRWSKVILADRSVHHARGSVAWLLSTLVNPTHQWVAWPSATTIANGVGIDRRDVLRHLGGLVDAGYLTHESEPRKGKPNRYVLTLPTGSGSGDHTLTVAGSEPVPPTPEPVGTTPSTQGDETPQSDGSSPHPSSSSGPRRMNYDREAGSNAEQDDAVAVAGAPSPVVLRGKVRPPFEGHGRVVIGSRLERFPFDGLDLLFRVGREAVRHPDCDASFCGLPNVRANLAVVGAPPEQMGGLVEALRAAGVVVDDLAA